MNLLTDRLPEEIVLDGITVRFNADHRSCIRAILALLDDASLSERAASEAALAAFYPEIPAGVSLEEAFYSEIEFLSGVSIPTLPGMKAEKESRNARAFSFLYDQDAVYAAFLEQYHINLAWETLHWWHFKALLDNLHDNPMANRMLFRTAQEDASTSKEERARMRKERERWKLPSPAVETKHADAIAQALLNGNVQELEAALGR